MPISIHPSTHLSTHPSIPHPFIHIGQSSSILSLLLHPSTPPMIHSSIPRLSVGEPRSASRTLRSPFPSRSTVSAIPLLLPPTSANPSLLIRFTSPSPLFFSSPPWPNLTPDGTASCHGPNEPHAAHGEDQLSSNDINWGLVSIGGRANPFCSLLFVTRATIVVRDSGLGFGALSQSRRACDGFQ
jgi:hypothetical protein